MSAKLSCEFSDTQKTHNEETLEPAQEVNNKVSAPGDWGALADGRTDDELPPGWQL